MPIGKSSGHDRLSLEAKKENYSDSTGILQSSVDDTFAQARIICSQNERKRCKRAPSRFLYARLAVKRFPIFLSIIMWKTYF